MFNGRSIPSASSVTGILLGIAATPALPNGSAAKSRALGRLYPSPGDCCCLSMLDFRSLPAAHPNYVNVSPGRAVCPATSSCRGSDHPWVTHLNSWQKNTTNAVYKRPTESLEVLFPDKLSSSLQEAFSLLFSFPLRTSASKESPVLGTFTRNNPLRGLILTGFIIRLHFQELPDCYELPGGTSARSSGVNKISTLHGHASSNYGTMQWKVQQHNPSKSWRRKALPAN